MTGLMAESEDDDDGECGILEMEDCAYDSDIENGSFGNLARNKCLGFELFDSPADDVYICGECEFDEELDSKMIICQSIDCDYFPP